MTTVSNTQNSSIGTREAAFSKLQEHFEQARHLKMRDLFAQDKERFQRFSLQFEDVLLDYSKNLISSETMTLLLELARASNVESWRDRMFHGEKINDTEHRAVLHVALRNRSDNPINIDGEDVMPAVRSVIAHMSEFAGRVRSGDWTGYTGERITDVVNVGIGGSDLGPKMVYEALKPYRHSATKAHFISNIDGAHTEEILEELNPETTLFVVSSKTFTTQETITNANTARSWFLASAGDEAHIAKHFVAVSTNREAVIEFGIDPENMFEFWDWVGGRYSLWSAIGLSIMILVGEENFTALLDGAHAMDNHFATAPLGQNMPVILAMLGVWHNNFFGAETHAILPYDHYLRSLPMYLEQADMESNGKSVDRDGHHVNYNTGPIVWGATGINGQHAFYQLIHQGTKMIPADFIASIQTHSKLKLQHDIMMSNFFAQTEALMRGRTLEETCAAIEASGLNVDDVRDRLPHMVFEGNHPSNTILLNKLTPYSLGLLVALYEHKIFVQGIVWNLNSYDQWGVELGKQLAKQILDEIESADTSAPHDSSTHNLISYYLKRRQQRAEKRDG
ncbi:MAG: glucose-6-phosphate isomerase [Gammaproteobacteria bacterium]|nr:glucose-6-phosphate isomerase [Gammaproteobacteria bacterium]